MNDSDFYNHALNIIEKSSYEDKINGVRDMTVLYRSYELPNGIYVCGESVSPQTNFRLDIAQEEAKHNSVLNLCKRKDFQTSPKIFLETRNNFDFYTHAKRIINASPYEDKIFSCGVLTRVFTLPNGFFVTGEFKTSFLENFIHERFPEANHDATKKLCEMEEYWILHRSRLDLEPANKKQEEANSWNVVHHDIIERMVESAYFEESFQCDRLLVKSYKLRCGFVITEQSRIISPTNSKSLDVLREGIKCRVITRLWWLEHYVRQQCKLEGILFKQNID